MLFTWQRLVCTPTLELEIYIYIIMLLLRYINKLYYFHNLLSTTFTTYVISKLFRVPLRYAMSMWRGMLIDPLSQKKKNVLFLLRFYIAIKELARLTR